MAKNSGYRPTRRKFVQSLAMGAGLCAGGAGFRVWGNGLEPYEGKLLVTLQLLLRFLAAQATQAPFRYCSSSAGVHSFHDHLRTYSS